LPAMQSVNSSPLSGTSAIPSSSKHS
jgi:hypothetical protein